MSQLIIDTSTNQALVAIDHRDFGREILQIDERRIHDSSAVLIKALDQLIEEIDPNDIAQVIVGAGPGSYTGLRVGFAAAKMWAYAHKLPLVGVSSLFAFAPTKPEIDQTTVESGQIAVAFDARGGGIYALVGLMEKSQLDISWQEPQIIPWTMVNEFSKKISAVYHPQTQHIESRWFEAQGRNVQWHLMQPRSIGLIETSKKKGVVGTWNSHYQEVKLNYLK